MIFFGFGLQDAELMRLLKRLGPLANPASPIFAFVSDDAIEASGWDPDELLSKHNIDVVPYPAPDGSHEALRDLLNVYRSFTVRRSMNFRQGVLAAPSFDPETTSLLVYNRLCLQAGQQVPGDIVNLLIRARILALMRFKQTVTRVEILKEVDARVRAMGRVSVQADASQVDSILRELETNGLVEVGGVGSDTRYELSASGMSAVSESAGEAQLRQEQFAASLRGRAEQMVSVGAAKRVAVAADAFFKEAVEKRSLGVAMTIYSSHPQGQAYHMVGLLQSYLDTWRDCPHPMRQLHSVDSSRTSLPGRQRPKTSS